MRINRYYELTSSIPFWACQSKFGLRLFFLYICTNCQHWDWIFYVSTGRIFLIIIRDWHYVYLLRPIITYLATSFIHKINFFMLISFVDNLPSIIINALIQVNIYKKKLIYPLQFTLLCKIDLMLASEKKSLSKNNIITDYIQYIYILLSITNEVKTKYLYLAFQIC